MLLQPWRVVQTVTVQSATIPATAIEADANIKKNTPLWRVTGQTNFIVQRILQKNPDVDAAQVTVNGQHVTIKVIEKVTAGYVYQNGQWLVMDRNGRQQKVAAPKGDAPIYAGFKSQSELQQVVQGFVGLELTLRQNISQITLSPNKDNAHRLVIIMDDGNTVYATSKTFGQKISYYPGIALVGHRCAGRFYGHRSGARPGSGPDDQTANAPHPVPGHGRTESRAGPGP